MNNSQIDIAKLTYRQAVIGIVVDRDHNFLVTQLVDYGQNEWRFPGGGVDESEIPEKALLRELAEELNSDKFKILKKSKYQIKYDWPMEVIETRLRKKGKTYRGQIQDQFLVLFEGDRQEINFNPLEIRQIKWIKYPELKKHFNFPNQWEEAELSLKELLPDIASG